MVSCFRDLPSAVVLSSGASDADRTSLPQSKPYLRSRSQRNALCVESTGDICPRRYSRAGYLTCSSRNPYVRQKKGCADDAKIQRGAELRLLLTLPCVRVQDPAERAYAVQFGHDQMPTLQPGLRGEARQKTAEYVLSYLGRQPWRTGKANRVAHGTPGFASG
jgi:hypothetical protein